MRRSWLSFRETDSRYLHPAAGDPHDLLVWLRRRVAAAVVLMLVVTLAPSTLTGAGGGTDPLSWLGSRFRDAVGADGEDAGAAGPVGGEVAWEPPGRAAAGVVARQAEPPGERVREVRSERTATRTVYELADGRQQVELSSVPVRFRDESGVWRSIDTEVVPVGDGRGGFVYGNDGTGFATRFGQRSDALLRVRLGQRWVTFGLPGERRRMTPRVSGSTVTYAGVWEGADLVFDVTPNGVKESIVLRGAPSEDVSFDFTARGAGVEPVPMPDGSVAFYAANRSGGPVFSLPKPFMVDAKADPASPHGQVYSDQVAMSTSEQDGITTVRIRPDSAWLAAAERVYPVVVDPTVVVQPEVSTSKDAMIASYAATSNFGTDPRLGVGRDRFGSIRSLVRFELAGVVPSGTPVDAAQLSLYWDNLVLDSSTGSPVPLEARGVTQDWATSTVTWNSIAASMGDVAGTGTFDAGLTNTWVDFPVTGLVADWVAGTRPNYGFMLKAADESAAVGGPFFWAGEFPVAPVGRWPTFTTRTAPKLTVTFGLPAVAVREPTTVRATGAELSWEPYIDPSPDAADDLVEYQVHRSTVAAFAPSAATLVAPLPAGTTSYVDTTAAPETTVFYRVVVVRADGQSSAAQAWEVVTPPAGYVDASLPTVGDTTITACEASVPHDLLLGRPLLGSGYVPGGFGVTRMLIKWDTSPIPDTARVVEAHGRLWRTMYSGKAVTFAAHPLTREFDEQTATLFEAAAGVPWTSTGGDALAQPADQLTLGPTTNAVWVNLELTSQLEAWRANPGSNHGVLFRVVKEPNKACPGNGEGAVFVSKEGAEESVRPRLHVRYTDTTVTFHAADTPTSLYPGETVTVPVTVTNTSSQTWPAASTRLGYWWRHPDGTDATAGSGLLTELPQDLAPGATVTVQAQVQAPPLSGEGNRAEGYTLAWDLYDPVANEWRSASHGLPQLPQQVRVEDPTSDLLGLEKFYAYSGTPTGAGTAVMNNLYAGNVAWSYNAFSNPSRGPHTFVRMTYNSLDTSASAMGFGWSLQASTIQRLGSQLSFHPPGRAWPTQVRMVDGDGTSHVWVLDTHGQDRADCTPSTCDYTHPRGVHLYLQRTGSSDPTRAWVFTKPDRTQFFFDADGFQSAIVDKNGNTMTFVYEERRSQNKPTKFLQYITDAAGRRTLEIEYYEKGDAYTFIDDDTWQEVTDTNLTNPFIIDNVKAITDISGRRVELTYSDKGLLGKLVDGAGTSQPKVFGYRYDATQGNKNVKLVQVTDPRGNATDLAYYTAPVDPQNKWKLQTVTDRLDEVTQYAYVDPDGPQGGTIHTTATDALAHATDFVLDGFGRPTSITNTKNQSTSLAWDTDHNVTGLTEDNGAHRTWEFDTKTGLPLTITDAEANQNGTPGTTLSYNTTLNGYVADLVGKVSPEGRTWQFDYDDNGNLVSVTDPLGVASAAEGDYTTVYEYDELGNQTRLIDANGHPTRYADFGPNGYPRIIHDALQNPTTFIYDDRGQVVKVTDALGKITTQSYDVLGRPLEQTVPKDQENNDFITTPAPVYDANDNVVQRTAPNGAITESTFDANDRLVATIDPTDQPGGPERRTTFTYDAVGNQLTVTEPNGNLAPEAGDFTTTYTYDEIYQVIAVTNANGDTVTAEYDNVGNVITVVDARKNATPDPDDFTARRVYDLDRKVISSTNATGHTTSVEYDRDGLEVAKVDRDGNRVLMSYDARGALIKQQVPHETVDGNVVYRTTRFEYDQVGNQTKVVTPRGVATDTVADDFTYQTVYDELNRVKEEWTAYDPNDSRYQQPDKTIYHYDEVGRVATISAPPSSGESVRNDTHVTYFDNGWTKTTTDPWDIVTTYDYNVLGQQTSSTLSAAGGAVSRTMTWDFYPSGNLAARGDEGVPVGQQVALVDNSDFNNADSDGGWIRASEGTGFQGYDYHTHTPGSGSSTFTWNLVIPQDGEYTVSVRYPDVSGAATDARFTIDHSGGSVTEPVDQTAAAGTWVELGTFAFTESGADQKITLSDDANGTVIADAVRLVRDNSGEPDNEMKSFTYTYDANGNLVRLADLSPGAQVEAYETTYDELGRVTEVVERTGSTIRNTTGFTYDENGNVATRTHDDNWTRFDYDVRDLLIRVTNAASPSASDQRVDSFAYTPRGQVAQHVKPNGNVVDLTYYLDGSVRHEVEKTSTGAVVAEHTLEYTENGIPARDVVRLMNADDNADLIDTTYTFSYDPQDRISRVDKTGDSPAVETYVHDANSNVITQTVDGITTSHNYDRNRLMTSTAVGGLTSVYNYDPLGRLDTVATGGEVTQRYSYDGFDRIARLRAGSGDTAKTATYTYDPFDRTATQDTDGKTTTFTYLGTSGDMLQEHVDGTLDKSYEYALAGQKLTQFKYPDGGGTEISHYTYHPKGDVEALTKHSDGTTRATYGYTAYGSDDDAQFTGVDKPDPANPDQEPYNNYRFNGHRFDEAAGTYDMGFRNYDPGLNRFLSRDMYNGALDDLALAVDPFTGSRYAFAGGNPISNIELDGHGFLGSIGSAISGAAGAVKDFGASVVNHVKEDPLKFAVEVGVGIAVGVGVGAVCAATVGVGCVVAAGVVGGAVAAGAGYGVDVAQGDRDFSWGDLGKEMAIGAVIGGVTAGLGKGLAGMFRKVFNKFRPGGKPTPTPKGDTPTPGPRGGTPEPTPAPKPTPAPPAAAKPPTSSVPAVTFSRGRAPGIAQTFDDAVAAGAPTRLTRVDAVTRDANRRAALRGQPPAPAGQSLDEYPFACSAQGGCGSTVRAVPVGEQSYQGGVLSRFFQDYNVQPGDLFDVVFGP